jgi:heme-degrading monooxygenase HmoA
MFVRVTNVQVAEGRWTAYEVAAQRLTLEGSSHAPGRLATWLIRSAEDVNSGFSIQVWDSMEALERYERSDWFRSRLVPALELLLAGEYPVTRGEVRFLHDSTRGWVMRRPRW